MHSAISETATALPVSLLPLSRLVQNGACDKGVDDDKSHSADKKEKQLESIEGQGKRSVRDAVTKMTENCVGFLFFISVF